MEARILLEGHARVGSWMAIEVHLKNDGPPIVGELRLTGGAQGRTRFATRGRPARPSRDKTYLLYAQPPAFGARASSVDLVSRQLDDRRRPRRRSPSTTRASSSSASSPSGPGEIVGSIDLPPNQNNVAPLIVAARRWRTCPSASRPGRRSTASIWQDIDSDHADPGQLDAMRGWIAGGGRLVIAGGTAGTRQPVRLPRRHPAVPAGRHRRRRSGVAARVLGQLPAGATDLPALAGTLIARPRARDRRRPRRRGRALDYGSGAVTILGFDPTAAWIAEHERASTACGGGSSRAAAPAARSSVDDSQLVSGRLAAPGARAAADRRPHRAARRRTSCSSARSTTSSCAGSTGASGRGSRCRS